MRLFVYNKGPSENAGRLIYDRSRSLCQCVATDWIIYRLYGGWSLYLFPSLFFVCPIPHNKQSVPDIDAEKASMLLVPDQKMG